MRMPELLVARTEGLEGFFKGVNGGGRWGGWDGKKEENRVVVENGPSMLRWHVDGYGLQLRGGGLVPIDYAGAPVLHGGASDGQVLGREMCGLVNPRG